MEDLKMEIPTQNDIFKKLYMNYFKSIYCPQDGFLYYDEACLTVINVLDAPIRLFQVVEECYKCNFESWVPMESKSNVSLIVDIDSTTTFYYVMRINNFQSCLVTYHFEQHGHYKYVTDLSCDSVEVLKYPGHPYTSLLIYAVVVLIAWFLFTMYSYTSTKNREKTLFSRITAYFKKTKVKNDDQEEKSGLKLKRRSRASSVVTSRRIYFDEETGASRVIEYKTRGVNTTESLDELEKSIFEPKPLEFVEFESLIALRGLIAILWVFLEAEGRTYYFLQASPWHGLKISDALTGWLYWVLAASFYLRLHLSLISSKSRHRLLIRNVLVRSILYFLGGIVYNNINRTSPSKDNPDVKFRPISQFRIFGIFQRIGFVYLIIGSVEVYLIKNQIKRGRFFQDLRDTWLQWLFVSILVVVHTIITFYLPVPGCPTGYQGPGGRTGHPRCTGGAALYIDHSIFSLKHLMEVTDLVNGPFGGIYHITIRFDPQGLLGTLTTCLLMSLGMQAARIFIYFMNPVGRIIRLTGWALIQLLLGSLLCSFSGHEGFIPLNQYLMSLSYVLVVSGLAYIGLLVLYVFITYKNLWSGVPAVYTGVNLIPMLVGSKLFHDSLPFIWSIPQSNQDTHSEFLIRATWCITVWCYVCYILLRERVVFPV